MATSPQFTSKPNCNAVTVNVANTKVDVITATTNGTRVDKVFITAQGTTTAGNVRLYVSDKIIKDIPVKAITAVGGVANFSAIAELDIVLKTGQKLQASTVNSEAFDIVAIGGDF